MGVDHRGAMSWYYSKNGTQLGPVSEEELAEKGRSGEVSPADLVWKEGMGDWLPLSQFPELQGAAGTAMVPPVSATGGGGNVPIQQPPVASPSMVQGQQIPNYLWQSIVATVLCCMPFGVVAIVYAAKVDGLVARGDIAGANAASKSAKTWVTVAVGSWLVVAVLYVILIVIGAAAGGLQ